MRLREEKKREGGIPENYFWKKRNEGGEKCGNYN
jgi:hypothetical protein